MRGTGMRRSWACLRRRLSLTNEIIKINKILLFAYKRVSVLLSYQHRGIYGFEGLIGLGLSSLIGFFDQNDSFS